MDIWQGAQYYDSDWAEEAADDAFAADLADLWEEATPAERRQIAKERGALGVKGKARRDLTATEWAALERRREWRMHEWGR